MARIKIEKVIDHLGSEVRNALEDAVHEVLPNARFDSYDLFRAFSRAIDRRCGTWEQIPDSSVKS